MKRIRSLHLLIGCFVAPMVLLLSASGAMQALDLHRGLKDGSYQPPRLVAVISSLHMNEAFGNGAYDCSQLADPIEAERCRKQRAATPTWQLVGRFLLKALLIVSAGGVFLNAVTGIALAIQMRRWRRYAIIALAIGAAVPTSLLLL